MKFDVVGSNAPITGRSWDGPTNSGFENQLIQNQGVTGDSDGASASGHDSFQRQKAIRLQTIKPSLLNHRFGVFGSSVPAQQLGKILGERRARQDHITSRFVRFLLQIALHV